MEDASWTVIGAFLVAGFVLLAKGADWLVDGGTSLARRAGVSTLAIGLTVVAWGTSAPEVVVSGVAAWKGDAGMSLGNVLGSNVANIGLVLGACATVLPVVLQKAMRPRELIWLFASLGALWHVSSDGAITRADALVLLGVFAVYNAHLFLTAREAGVTFREGEMTSRRATITAACGMAAITLGSYLVVTGAEVGAYRLGMTKLVVGLTVLAIGTSLPELAAGLGGAFKGESDISLGNVVGSNVFNLIAVLGIVGLIRPLVPSDRPGDTLRLEFERALAHDFPTVLGFSLAAVLLPWLPGGGRVKGVLLLLGFGSYIAFRVVEGRAP